MPDTVTRQGWTHVQGLEGNTWVENPIQGGSEYWLSDLQTSKSPDREAWKEFPYTAHGDYCGHGDVGVSNYRSMKEEFGEHKDIAFISGDYGFQAVIYNTATKDEEILDILEKLENYPLIDEDMHSEVTMEWENEAWDNWARSDFQHKLYKLHPDLEEVIDDISDDDIWTLFHEAQEEANEYWEYETSGAWIDVDKIASKVTAEDINKFAKAPKEE
jgi:hypothetical protein